MVRIAHILGLAVFCGVTAAYGSSPNETENKTSISSYGKTGTSTSLNPAYTGKVKPGKMDQKDYDGENKKGGDAKKEQKDYDGANKKGDVKKEKNYGGDKKEYDVKKEKNYDGDKKEYDVKKEKNYDGDKKEYDVKESGKPDGYGSGSSNWDQEYDCVQQCKAKYGKLPSATSKPKAEAIGGKTHTVIVAPTQGVLRYVPFAVKPSAGDTVQFMWNANNHTVTKSSALLPCNKSLDNPIASGTQNKSFVFNLVINDTQPIYIFCGTPSHCQKGMFAMINPPSNINGSTSMGNMIPLIAANNSGVAAYSEYTTSQTNGSTIAANWGSDIDLAALPEWSHPYVAENVLYTRSFLGNNAETIKGDGSIDLSGVNTTPLVIPKNVAAVLPPPPTTSPTSPIVTSSPGTYQTMSDAASPSDLSRSSSLSSGGYVSSASKALILGPVAFIVSFIVV